MATQSACGEQISVAVEQSISAKTPARSASESFERAHSISYLIKQRTDHGPRTYAPVTDVTFDALADSVLFDRIEFAQRVRVAVGGRVTLDDFFCELVRSITYIRRNGFIMRRRLVTCWAARVTVA